MTICVNGETVAIEPSCTVRQLLEQFDLLGSSCAVEVNARVVPKRDHDEHLLGEGDVVEIVTLVGGG